MTRKDALAELIAKVEAGTLAPVDLIVLEPQEHAWAERAYNGSLDAAKTLHDAVLPGCGKSVDATMPDLGICVDIHNGGVVIGSGDLLCEACAWLLAILRALHAQEQGE